MAQIIFDHVTKKYKDAVALSDVSFQIDRKERRREEYAVESYPEAGGGDLRADRGRRPEG